MFGECHAHLIMDGLNYKDAISIHKDHVNDEVIRKHLKAYEELGIVFVRDGVLLILLLLYSFSL